MWIHVVIRMELRCLALAPQLDYGQSNLESPARPMMNITQDEITDTGTDLSERSALATHLEYGFLNLESLSRPMVDVALDHRPMEGITAPLPVESSGLAMAPSSGPMEHLSGSRPLEHSVLDIKGGNDKLDIHDGPLFGSDHGWSCLEITDAMRREALRNRSTGRVSAGSVNSLILSPEEDCLGEKEKSLDDVSSEGLRQWNMDRDIEYQYETFNGLPVYYGGDMYDSEDSEDDPLERVRTAYVEDYNFDVPEGMELMTYNRRRPDGGEARSVDTVDMVPMCRTVSCVTRIAPDESSDTSGTDTAVINGSDIEDFCQWPELSHEEDCFGSDVG